MHGRRRVPRFLVNLCLLSAALLGPACQKSAPPPPPAPVRVAPARDGGPPPEPEAAGAPEVPDAGPGKEGDWIVAGAYRFRLDELRRCGGAPAVGPDAAAAPPAPRTWVGARVDIGARGDALMVTPRDVTLERGGVILQAIYVNPPTLSGCLPALPIKQVRGEESAHGFALFDVPEGFRKNGTGPFTLAYRPTRWGGAKRAEIEIPPCLDLCTNSEKAAPPPPRKSRKKS
jgi:hypothetical protein